ncbi:hypothetical protein B0H14DRAFT_3477634 [Mycena olivaceomarginata]|nr:hypothetical protein B0H14DRAFT_3477634 [Mycena olivaceomarginata]
MDFFTVNNSDIWFLLAPARPVDQQVQISKLNHVKPRWFHFEPFTILTVPIHIGTFVARTPPHPTLLINFDASL